MSLYPLKFRPRFVEKIWGGRKIESVLGKPLPPGKQIGESWELYDFPPGIVDGSSDWISSEIANGPLTGRTLHDAVGEFGREIYGDVPLLGPYGQFPILIKFLDAREDLSVQVHPDESYAEANAGAHLKNEAWYVMENDPGARLLLGLRPGTSPKAFRDAAEAGNVDRLINAVPVEPGQCYYLPSGTVHALGAGILVAEVQTPSDTTFRVFDFNRVEPSTGKPRALHVEQALQCIDFSKAIEAHSPADATGKLVASPYFHIEKIRFSRGVHGFTRDQPAVWIVLEGRAELRTGEHEPVQLSRGETALLPASMNHANVHSEGEFACLEVTFPTKPPVG